PRDAGAAGSVKASASPRATSRRRKIADDAAFRERLADALRLIRTRKRLTQTAISKIEGAPDSRTLSHWETRRKVPTMRLLTRYLEALGLDLHDLQDALDQAGQVGTTVRRIGELDGQLDCLARVVEDLAERRMVVLEKRLELGVGRLVERLDAIERAGSIGPAEAVCVDQPRDLGAEIERLAERVAALERPVEP
ncbi:MAG: helix-turn-helix domain-containing protein, partial [bacterium]|nr:helix-turn-helix domain-containing protein [bacterium]